MDFFSLSKIGWAVITPGHFLVGLLVVAVVLKLYGQGLVYKIGRILSMITVIIFLSLTFIPFGFWFFGTLENSYTTVENLPDPDNVDGIIVLGGGLDVLTSVTHNQITFGDGAERLIVFKRLLSRFPDTTAIYTGGSGHLRHQDHKEADFARRFFEMEGVASDRILYERRSRNTYENAVYSAEALGGVPTGQWILITSAFHMPRSVAVFEKQGWNVLPYPVDFRLSQEMTERAFCVCFSENLNYLERTVKELVGMIAYHLSGRI